jgi:hypothetical protein
MTGNHDDAWARRRREDTYALRRAMVRKLQIAARGVTRRERVELHRRFAADWTAFAADERATRPAVVSKPPRWTARTDRPGRPVQDQAELFELDLIA